MKKIWFVTLLLAVSPACRSTTQEAPSTQAEWSYTGDTGPGHWGELSPDYALAATGTRQSPIDIATKRTPRRDGPPLQADYDPIELEILNNGHTVEVVCDGAGELAVGGKEYELAQFHVHSPSEHTVDGKHMPLELHLVHKSAAGVRR
jgi:carbonic anhydrase